MRMRITITAVTGVLLILVLGAVVYAVTAYRGMIGSSISDVTDGPKLPPIEMPAGSASTEPPTEQPTEQPTTQEPAPAPVSEPSATPEPPANEPPPVPEPAEPAQAAPESTRDPAARPAVSEPSIPGTQPDEPVAVPDPGPMRALPAGLVGARWALKREATAGGVSAALAWSAEIAKGTGGKPMFEVPDALEARGVHGDGAVLSIAESDFRVRATIDGKDLRAVAEKRGAMPAAVAELLGRPAGEDTVEGWSALMKFVAIDVVDPSGASIGTAQHRTDLSRPELVAGAPASRMSVPSEFLLLAQVFLNPGAPSERRVIAQSFVEPGAACTLQPTALIQVHLERGEGAGFATARLSALDQSAAGKRRSELMEKHRAVVSLIDQVKLLVNPISGASPDSSQIAALEAAWMELAPVERAGISPQSPDAAPRTAVAMRAVHSLVDPRLRARRDSLLHELGELKPEGGKLPSMILRVSTPEGVIIAERSLSLGTGR